LDPKYSIALTDIFAEMVSKMMMKPIEALGDSIYVFNKSVLSKKNSIYLLFSPQKLDFYKDFLI